MIGHNARLADGSKGGIQQKKKTTNDRKYRERRPTGKSAKIPIEKESKREIHPNTNRERIKAPGEDIPLALQFLIEEGAC